MCIKREEVKELNKAVREYREFKSLYKQTEEQIKELEKKITSFLKEHDNELKAVNSSGKEILRYIGSDYEATLTPQERKTLDAKRLEQDLGDLSEYTKTTNYDVLRIK